MIRIRPATPADLRELSGLEAEIFGSDAWSPRQLDEELRAPHRSYFVLAADPETGPDGTAGAERVLGYAGLFHPGAVADVQTIAVAAEARGAGHGRALMRALMARARATGAEEIFLEVRADNPVARALYADLGFDAIDVRKNYYPSDGVDAIVMRLSLAPRAECPAAPGPVGAEQIAPPLARPEHPQEPRA